MQVTFIGGADGVTGSCTLLTDDRIGVRALVDCGAYAERPAGIPEWALATSLTHILDFGAGNQLLTRVDYSHESNTKINNGLPTFGPNNFMREVNLVNASATVSPISISSTP